MIGPPPLSTRAKALLAEERLLPRESEALKQRALDRARLALDRPSGVALRGSEETRPFESARRRAPRALLLSAAALAVAGLAAAGAGVFRLAKSPTESAEPTRAAAPPTTAQTPQVAPAPLPAKEPAAPAPSEPHRATPPVESARGASIQTYAVELGLLEPARSSIARGDYAGAMTAIARHQREYPRGQLAQEREALRVRALWGLGQRASAENAAAAFRKRYPKSGLLSWMKQP